MKNKNGFNKLKINGKHVEEEAQIAEVLNDFFQSVFTGEGTFGRPVTADVRVEGLSEIEVTVDEVRIMMEDLDARKAQGPDGVSDWVVKGCRDQPAHMIYKLIITSLREGVVPNIGKKTRYSPLI